MEPVTFYRLGQIRHQEILQWAEREHQPRRESRPSVTALIGRWLLAVGARLVGSAGCANVATRGYTITVCSAQST